MFVQAFILILFSFSRDLNYQSFANGINCLTKISSTVHNNSITISTLKIMDFKISLIKTVSLLLYDITMHIILVAMYKLQNN